MAVNDFSNFIPNKAQFKTSVSVSSTQGKVKSSTEHLYRVMNYRIAGKFGKEFNLANWRGIEKIAKLKIAKF